MRHLENKLIWDLVTGDLPESDMTAVQEHLSICQKCRQEHEVISLIHQESFLITGEQPSLRFSKTIMEKIEVDLKMDQAVQFWTTLTKYTLIVAIFVAAISCLVILGYNNSYTLDQLDSVGSMMFALLFTCIGLWVFYLMDRAIFSIYMKKD